MRDLIDLGCVPANEDCAQVGSERYQERARQECRAFIGQLRRTCGEEPDGASLSLKSNPHDFGSYLSVVCYFEEGNERASEYAFRCEREGPKAWDDLALQELSTAASRRTDEEVTP